MNRRIFMWSYHVKCVPHTRGDEPAYTGFMSYAFKRSPHTWGWTGVVSMSMTISSAFPTHVGMNRQIEWFTIKLLSVPHTRGDEPMPIPVYLAFLVRSPHTWGWTVLLWNGLYPPYAFPTHVGMNQQILMIAVWFPGVPHTRGDEPGDWTPCVFSHWCSPHTWGWTGIRWNKQRWIWAFPTHMGMNRAWCKM